MYVWERKLRKMRKTRKTRIMMTKNVDRLWGIKYENVKKGHTYGHFSAFCPEKSAMEKVAFLPSDKRL